MRTSKLEITNIAAELNISFTSVNLNFHEVTARWVPKQLVEDHIQNCLGIATQHLA